MNSKAFTLISKFEKWNYLAALLFIYNCFSVGYALLFIQSSAPNWMPKVFLVFLFIFTVFITYIILLKNIRITLSNTSIIYHYPWGTTKKIDHAEIIGYAFGTKEFNKYDYRFCIWILKSNQKWMAIPNVNEKEFQQAILTIKESGLKFLGLLKTNSFTGRPYRNFQNQELTEKESKQLWEQLQKKLKLHLSMVMILLIFTCLTPFFIISGYKAQKLNKHSITTTAVFVSFEKRNSILSILDPQRKAINSLYFFVDENGKIYKDKTPTSSHLKYPSYVALRYSPEKPERNQMLGNLKQALAQRINDPKTVKGQYKSQHYYKVGHKKKYLITYSYSYQNISYYGIFASGNILDNSTEFDVIFDQENPFYSKIKFRE